MTGFRLDNDSRVDRQRSIEFTWRGRRYSGFHGDTLASALLAQGISIVGRSFKYHRPRGLLAAGLEEPNAIVQIGRGSATIPNLKATQVQLVDGLVASPVNAWPSVDVDVMALAGLFKRFIPAAFYYKTFMWPGWRWFEPAIRRAAGLGVVPVGSDPDRYEHRYHHVDVLVVGSGAAGLAAADAAAKRGDRVMLVEADTELGGGLLCSTELIDGLSPLQWRDVMLAALAAEPGVSVLPRTIAFGYYDHDLVGLCQRLEPRDPAAPRLRERLHKVRAGRVILATGAFERPLPFIDNDRPGIMLASAAQAYAVRFGVASGRRIVIATNNDSAYRAAVELRRAGLNVVCVIDSRPDLSEAANALAASGVRVICNAAPLAARGRRRVRSLIFAPLDTAGAQRETINCDSVLVSGGWSPAVHLHSQAGGQLAFDLSRQAFLPTTSPQNSVCIGAAAGLFDVDAAIISGRAAAAGSPVPNTPADQIGPLRSHGEQPDAGHSVWLDFQNDVTTADIQLAARENFRSIEHVKRYTTLGMASDQGKTSNVPAIQLLAGLLDKAPSEVGTTKFRPPYDPITIGVFAGRAVGADLMPTRAMAADDVQLAAGARMDDYGGWLRPACFPLGNESEEDAVAREVRAVRTVAGLFEASPLGKIEVVGPDAGRFLDRMYVNSLSTLKPGRCRYSTMLDEHGVIYDDGIVVRVADDRFLVSTTSGRASAISARFEEWLQCEWPDLQVLTQDVTTAWAVMSLAGPLARTVLQRAGTDLELGADAFPHMTYREGSVGGIAARVQRVSFTGELAYEIAVAWRSGASLWEQIYAAGAPLGLVPFGVEALMTMRVEKGYLHVGADTDGTTLPGDIGLSAVIEKKQSDFVGRRSTMRPDAVRADRRQLVGIEGDRGSVIAAGAHVLPAGRSSPCATDGWVTSATYSPTLDRHIGLALVVRGRLRIGERVNVWDVGQSRGATIVEPVFYDLAGERLRG